MRQFRVRVRRQLLKARLAWIEVRRAFVRGQQRYWREAWQKEIRQAQREAK